MKSRLIIKGILISLLVILLAGQALASYATCLYRSTITVTNTSATTYTNQRFTWVANASGMLSAGMIQADADDVYLVQGTTTRPVVANNLGSSTAVWAGRLPTIIATGNTTASLYVNSPADVRDQVWIADDADNSYAPDDATLDITDLLTLSANCYLYTAPGAEREIISKEGAYELYVDAANWGIRMHHAAAPVAGANFSPTGNGTVQLTPSAGTNWECVDEAPPLGAGADADYVELIGADTYSDLYSITGLPAGATITAITISYRVAGQTGDGVSQFATPIVYSPTTGIVAGAEAGIGGAGAYVNFPAVVVPYTGGTDGLQIGINMRRLGPAFGWIRCSQLFATIDYTPPDAGHTATTPITVTNAWVNIRGTYDSGANELIIYEGAATVTTNPGAGNINTNPEPVHVAEYDGDIDDVRIGDTALLAPTWRMDLDFEPDQISATVITDQSASTNDVTYALSALPAGVASATVGSLISTEAIPSYGGTELVPSEVVGIITESSDMYTADAAMDTPGTDIDALVTAIATDVGLAARFLWWFIAFVIMLATIIGIYYVSHHLAIGMLGATLWAFVFAAGHVLPLWIAFALIVISLGVLASERSPNL